MAQDHIASDGRIQGYFGVFRGEATKLPNSEGRLFNLLGQRLLKNSETRLLLRMAQKRLSWLHEYLPGPTARERAPFKFLASSARLPASLHVLAERLVLVADEFDQVWIDRQDFAVVRIEGRPAAHLSFWIKRANFVRDYEKVGGFWLPYKDETMVEVRLYGKKVLTIDHRDYAVKGKPTMESLENHCDSGCGVQTSSVVPTFPEPSQQLAGRTDQRAGEMETVSAGPLTLVRLRISPPMAAGTVRQMELMRVVFFRLRADAG